MSILDAIRRVTESSGVEEKLESVSGHITNFSPVRLAVLISISTVAMIKAYLTLIGVLDIVVGMYGLLAISMVFASFFLSYTKYEDPAKRARDRSATNNNNEVDNFQSITNSGSGSSLLVLTSSPAKEPSVSIIIPVFNEEELISGTVESCTRIRYPPEKMEIILVNDGSTDGTYSKLEAIKQQFSHSRIKLVQLEKNVGKRKAIREAITQGNAEGDVIILVDSDCVVDENAVQALVDSLRDPNVGAVTGHGLVKNNNQNLLTKIQETWYDGQFSVLKGMESSLESVTCCSGILSAYKREAMMPCLDRWCNDRFLGAEFKPGDDRHLTSFVLGGSHYYLGKEHRVWNVKYCESAITHTEVPFKLKKFIKQQARWKKSWVRLFFFNMPFYFRYRPWPAAYIYYMQSMLSFISPLVALRSLVLLPLQGDFFNALVYLSGISFIGTLYAVEFKLRNPNSGTRWLYRLLVPFLSVGLLNFLIYYSLLTMRSKSWMTR